MKYMVEAVHEKLGDEGIKKLQKEYGNINFLPAKDYSEEENVRLLLAVARVLFGKADEHGLFETGRILAQKFIQSKILKIGFKVVSSKTVFKNNRFNPTVLRLIEKAIPKFAPSLKIRAENPDPQTLIISFYETLMPRKIYEGEWYELFKTIGGEIITESKQLSPNSFQIIIKSEQFKNIEGYLETRK